MLHIVKPSITSQTLQYVHCQTMQYVHAHPLQLLYTTPPNTGEIPLHLKWAFITPIYKGGSRDMPPKLPFCCPYIAFDKNTGKKITAKNVHQFFETHQKMNPKQYGWGSVLPFAATGHHNKILEELEKPNNVDVILDFAKPFNKVDHNILNNLKKIELIAKSVFWHTSFYQKQFVTANRTWREALELEVAYCKCQCSYGQLQTIWSSMPTNLYCDMEKNRKWKLKSTNHDYSNIDRKEQVRDLAMVMSAAFIIHFRNIVKKARDKMGWFLSVPVVKALTRADTLWSLVIPCLLRYCCQLWNPWKAKRIIAAKAIQRAFTYKITEVRHLNYWKRLHELKLYSIRDVNVI